MTQSYVHALALGLDPAWRRLSAETRRDTATTFAAAVSADPTVTTETYSSVGIKAGTDLLIWRLARSLAALEVAAARALRTGLGRWLTVRQSLLGLIGTPSTWRAQPAKSSRFSRESERGTSSSIRLPSRPSGTCCHARCARGR